MVGYVVRCPGARTSAVVTLAVAMHTRVRDTRAHHARTSHNVWLCITSGVSLGMLLIPLAWSMLCLVTADTVVVAASARHANANTVIVARVIRGLERLPPPPPF